LLRYMAACAALKAAASHAFQAHSCAVHLPATHVLASHSVWPLCLLHTHNSPPPIYTHAHTQVSEIEPVMAAEDFSFFTRAMPSAYAWMGIRDDDLATGAALHSPSFRVDESALKRGAALHAALAFEFLRHGLDNSSFAGSGADGKKSEL
jgi:metal-dependent amidase/aminoacylase/carboxypeptidase family protein